MTSKYPALFLGLVLGIVAGLVYGWVIQPVEYIDTSPDALRIDYRTDYMLMVAESFDADQNLNLARIRLASLGPDLPETYLAEAIQYATEEAFSPRDIELLVQLQQTLLDRTPFQGSNQP